MQRKKRRNKTHPRGALDVPDRSGTGDESIATDQRAPFNSSTSPSELTRAEVDQELPPLLATVDADISPTRPIADSDRKLAQFGRLLVRLRLRAGFATQDAAVKAIPQAEGARDRLVSKSMLSLYERGETQTLKPERLQLLANLYRVSYADLAQLFAEEVFGISLPSPRTLVLESSLDRCTLKGRQLAKEITIVSAEELARRQAKCEPGSEVIVAAVHFMDNDDYFDMVLANLLNRVSYRYLLPGHHAMEYRAFRVRLLKQAPQLQGMLDRSEVSLSFVQRPNDDFPVCFVIMTSPDAGTVTAFVGLLHGRDAQCFQVADELLVEQLKESAKWITALWNLMQWDEIERSVRNKGRERMTQREDSRS